MSKEYIAIISEGEKTEKQIVENLYINFFNKTTQLKEIIFLPFKTNIYTLWNVMKEDDFETNIIDLLIERDQVIADMLKNIEKRFISEIYLFFDYDGHAYKRDLVDDIIREMIETFNNETENGKIYVSYPMVEAIKDLKKDDNCFRRCSVIAKENIHYKRLVAKDTDFENLTSLKINDWYLIINHSLKKGNCIMSSKFEIPNYREYKKWTNQLSMFDSQLENFININQTVAVLSGFPFFLIDYFGEKMYKFITGDKSGNISRH